MTFYRVKIADGVFPSAFFYNERDAKEWVKLHVDAEYLEVDQVEITSYIITQITEVKL